MTRLRTWALAAACLAALAACTAPAGQDRQAPPQAQQDAPTPAQRPMRTGGPLPPRVEDLTCRVDADCAKKAFCAARECRCVDERCIALAAPVDPVIDPAPATSVR